MSRNTAAARAVLEESRPSPAEDTAREQGDAPGHTEIAEVAYQLWLDRNRGHGSDVEDWYLAIELIRRRSMK